MNNRGLRMSGSRVLRARTAVDYRFCSHREYAFTELAIVMSATSFSAPKQRGHHT